ncbi:flagellar assembly protein FliW [Desulfurivibrio dismutans]|uniref:flagellar assembly protein FliW n=1 Tax=Desulfurivibrio dismutans TaxID=1398908 RepID=UPI0023DB82F2|nr:flagellar assembly protein FliW [Desulfurivibrio alkaliphilus]MDF1615410.1 flagellar assembly protein FliW [Desulfurivibrio alkaliphilus]
MAQAAMKIEESTPTITVPTSRFGEISIDPEKIITMTSAFPGFPESRRFVLRQHSSKSPFMWLQSLDNPDLAFVVIQASRLVPQYQPELPAAAMRELGESNDGSLEMLLILAIPKGQPEQMTANLLGPVVLNPVSLLAKQVLLDPNKFDAAWPVFEPEEN